MIIWEQNNSIANKFTSKMWSRLIKRDMLQTAMFLDFIAEQISIRDKGNHEWMEDLCCAMIKDRVQHIRERAGELFLELDVE